jgi:hypothetical protein
VENFIVHKTKMNKNFCPRGKKASRRQQTLSAAWKEKATEYNNMLLLPSEKRSRDARRAPGV